MGNCIRFSLQPFRLFYFLSSLNEHNAGKNITTSLTSLCPLNALPFSGLAAGQTLHPVPLGAEHNGWKMEDVVVSVHVYSGPKQGRQGLLLFNLYSEKEMPLLIWLHCSATVRLPNIGAKWRHIALRRGVNRGSLPTGLITRRNRYARYARSSFAQPALFLSFVLFVCLFFIKDSILVCLSLLWGPPVFLEGLFGKRKGEGLDGVTGVAWELEPPPPKSPKACLFFYFF